MQVITAIIAIIAVFGMPVLIVSLGVVYKLRSEKMKNEIILKLVESGQTIPDTLLAPVHRKLGSGLRPALVWLGIGLGLMGSGPLMWSYGPLGAILVGVGLVCFMIGLGLLLAYWLEKLPAGDGSTEPGLPE